jgi:thioredoxin-like negative regulator of GroEL
MIGKSIRQQAEDHYCGALDLVLEGEQPGALAEYEKALALDPAFTEAMHGLAKTLQDMNRLDEAIAVANAL